MQTDNPNAPDYDWQADREWFNQRLANARIHNSELEQKLAAARAALRLVNDKHGPILEASVHDAVLACLGLKVHPNGTGYGYVPSGEVKS